MTTEPLQATISLRGVSLDPTDVASPQFQATARYTNAV